MIPNQISSRFQTVLGVSLLIISVGVLVLHFELLSLFSSLTIPSFGTSDFIEYWSAFRALLDKSNPYDPLVILQYQREVLGTLKQPLMMWNPPWLIAMLAPILRFEFVESAKIWFALSLVSTVVGGYLTWDAVSDQKKPWLLIVGTSIFFFPVWYTLALGQVSVLVFLGCSLLFWSVIRDRYLFFGPGLLLVSFKPHVAYLWLIALIWWVIKKNKTTAILSTLFCVTLLIGTTFFVSSNVLQAWYQSLYNFNSSSNVPAIAWQTPTLVGILRYIFGSSTSSPIWPVIFVPGISSATFLFFFIRRTGDINWRIVTPWLLCISSFTAPFGWVFDCSLLLIPQISMISMILEIKPNGWAFVLAGIFSIQIVTLVLATCCITSHDQYFWFTPIILISWLICNKYCSRT